MDTIIASCISAAVTLVICLITNNSQQEKTRVLMEYQISELRKQVEKHNGVIERTLMLEEKMRVANHRIDDIERKIENEAVK